MALSSPAYLSSRYLAPEISSFIYTVDLSTVLLCTYQVVHIRSVLSVRFAVIDQYNLSTLQDDVASVKIAVRPASGMKF